MKTPETIKAVLSLALLSASMLAVFGCSTDENPISPDKMSEIRKKESEERANFTPPSAPPKPATSGQ